VYVSLFRLGATSHDIAADATNGAAVLHAYVQHTFGSLGSGFLAVLIALACLVTAVGLTCACAEYFSQILPLSYRALVVILAGFSLLISNLGLTKLIMFSIPVAGIGVVGGLLLTHTPFSMQAYIGVIMLAGIVVSNAVRSYIDSY
jgi:LIVCS family branched-chain amino acid:cation transporter